MSPHTSTFIESMKFSKSKWLTYFFFVGLIPVFTRLLALAITHAGAVSPLAASDFVYFGLVLHISIINELEYLSGRACLEDHSKWAIFNIHHALWRTLCNGYSWREKRRLGRCCGCIEN